MAIRYARFLRQLTRRPKPPCESLSQIAPIGNPRLLLARCVNVLDCLVFHHR